MRCIWGLFTSLRVNKTVWSVVFLVWVETDDWMPGRVLIAPSFGRREHLLRDLRVGVPMHDSGHRVHAFTRIGMSLMIDVVNCSIDEYFAYVDGPERNAVFDRAANGRAELLAVMPFRERVQDYLKLCKRQGAYYDPEHPSALPSFLQLSKYCDCYPSTIARIASGETESPSSRIMDILGALAGVCPSDADCPPFEWKARVRDADRWLMSDPDTRGNILDCIIDGVSARKAAQRQQVA